MDIVQNSIRANARLVTVDVCVDEPRDMLTIEIGDDGDGMNEDTRSAATDPFYTTRTTRKVGLGLPYYEMAARMCGGNFEIYSERGKGTRVSAGFKISHIDRAPLGNTGQTFALLAGANPGVDFTYTLTRGEESFLFDTREIKDLLGGVGIDTPEIIVYMEEYINEQTQNITRGIVL
jgi:hypothetical protein